MAGPAQHQSNLGPNRSPIFTDEEVELYLDNLSLWHIHAQSAKSMASMLQAEVARKAEPQKTALVEQLRKISSRFVAKGDDIISIDELKSQIREWRGLARELSELYIEMNPQGLSK